MTKINKLSGGYGIASSKYIELCVIVVETNRAVYLPGVRMN